MSTAEDIVLAGSRPSQKTPIDAIHSRISVVLLIDSFVIFMIANMLAPFPASTIPGIACGIVWFAYKQKASWAYWFAPLIMGSASLMFLLFLALNLYHLFSTGEGSWLMVLIMAWASFSSIRFIRIHFHSVYKIGYSGHGISNQGLDIHPNEMLAACPSCLAVLAINPALLSLEDKCPHCDSPLVLASGEEE
jgi:hypothetical protein